MDARPRTEPESQSLFPEGTPAVLRPSNGTLSHAERMATIQGAWRAVADALERLAHVEGKRLSLKEREGLQ